jgi:hypothetical protein
MSSTPHRARHRLRSDRARDHGARRHASSRTSSGRAPRSRLACEPPRFGDEAIGGFVAAEPGPRRPYAGAVRDIVLGVQWSTAGRSPLVRRPCDEERRGLRRGAADDGALGTLGIITEVAQCLPMPKPRRQRVPVLGRRAIRLTNGGAASRCRSRRPRTTRGTSHPPVGRRIRGQAAVENRR